MKNKLPYCNLWIAFQTKFKLINLFTFKDKIPVFIRSNIAYKFEHQGCNITYYDRTWCYLEVRMCKELRVSTLAGKTVKGDNDFALKEHHLFCNHLSAYDKFSLLASNNNEFKVALMESLFINTDYSPFKKNRNVLPLGLFDDWVTYFCHTIAVDWSDFNLLILHRYCVVKWMAFYSKILACDFLRFQWFEIANIYVKFPFNNLSLKVTSATKQ